jgi:hypothetical protein
MSKLTKQQRRRRREQKKRDKKKRRQSNSKSRLAKPTPWVAPKMRFFSVPSFVRPDATREERLQLLRGIGERAQATFDEKYPLLGSWFSEYDAVYVLSFCAYYFFAYPEGLDPEVTGDDVFFHHYLEILQAFALYQDRALSVKPLMQDAGRLEREVREIGELMGLRLLRIPPELTSEADIAAHRLRTGMMMQTTAVRNWAYPHQLKRVVLDLAAAVRAKFASVHGVDPVALMEVLFALTEERTDLLNNHRDRVRRCLRAGNYKQVLAAYHQEFPDTIPVDGEQLDVVWEQVGKNKRNLLAMLICHSDLRLDDIYSFSLDHADSLANPAIGREALKRLLDSYSFQFGGLREFPKDHLILGNPVLDRPFIKLTDEIYFSAVWGVIPHIALDLLEDLIWRDEQLREQYTRAKAVYLEDSLEQLVRDAFPSASIHRGSLWIDGATGKEYENDLTVALDNFAIVFEAKSAGLTDPARRGAPRRLFETLQELIESPSDQAIRFVRHLQQNVGTIRFSTKRGATNTIDTAALKHFIPLGVTLSHLGMLSSNLKRLIAAEVVSKPLEELAPSISITDLEAVFELLPLEVEKIHYLARRREFEAHMEYEGDELDLLALYLDTGFNIGEDEYRQDVALNMALKSKELDPYFVGSREGRSVERPSLAMTDWWKDILLRVTERKLGGWVETAFILLNTTRQDQEKFEREFRKLVARMKKGDVDKQHNWVVWLSGPKRRRYFIAAYPYETNDKAVRDTVMGNILDAEDAIDARGAVVLGVDLHDPIYPYSVLARRASTNLFDTLTLTDVRTTPQNT